MPRELTPELDGAAIVMIGRFNASIFHPQWFAKHGLLREEEASTARNLVISDDVAQFHTSWLEFQVLPNKLQAATADGAYTDTLRDLLASVFELLEHTPVSAMGLNRQMHFKVDSEDEWHRIGDRLVPKLFWQQVLAGRPGMRTVTVQGRRDGSTSERVEVTVQPSVKVLPHGIYVHFNEHFEVGSEAGVGSLVRDLRDNWEDSQRFAIAAARKILALREELSA